MTISATTLFALAVPALLAAPAGAPVPLAEEPRPIRLEISAPHADFAIVLLAADDRVQPLGSGFVLADAEVRVLTEKDDGRFATDVHVPEWFLGAIYWQAVTPEKDAADGLDVSPVHKLEIPATDADAATADRIRPLAADTLADADDADTLVVKSIRLSVMRSDAGEVEGLLARFEATSDGYDLTTLRVDEGDGAVDVYLYRKLPGEGEGMLDIVEMHETTAKFAAAPLLRVFLAEGKTAVPPPELSFELLAEIEL